MANRGVFKKKKDGILWWAYDFRYNKARHRGWVLPVEGTSKKDANQALKSIKAETILTASKASINGQRVEAWTPKKILEAYEEYLKDKKPDTYRSYRYGARKFKPFFSKLKYVTPKDIVEYQALRRSQQTPRKTCVSGPTINRELAYCRAAWNRVLGRHVAINPFEKFDKYDEVERDRYLTMDELSRLLKACAKHQHLKDIAVTGIMTGLRKAEILNLHKDQLDFTLGMVHLKVKGKKTNTVPLPEELAPIFKRRLEESESGFVFENPKTKRAYTTIKHSWMTALADAKIADFVFHDLRHTYGTYMLLVTRDVRTTQALLGHSNIRMTQRYTHILNEQMRRSVGDLQRHFQDILDEQNGTKEDKQEDKP